MWQFSAEDAEMPGRRSNFGTGECVTGSADLVVGRKLAWRDLVHRSVRRCRKFGVLERLSARGSREKFGPIRGRPVFYGFELFTGNMYYSG